MQPWEKPLRRVAIAGDHAGLKLKDAIKKYLQNRGIEAVDLGTDSTEAVDYPDFGERVARLVSRGTLPQGILICGTGIGMSMTANKFPGVRAAVVTNLFMAKSSRSHNDANVLCLGERLVDEAAAVEIVAAWLDEPFGGERHERRVNKIKALDRAIVPLPPADKSNEEPR